MNDKKELFEVLDAALDRVLKGESIDIVLADYPRHADELGPLLKTALDTHNAALITPRPDFRQRAALEFQQAIQQMPVPSAAKQAAPGKSRGIFGWGVAWSASFALVLVVLISGTGVVAAANRAMPDSPLYSVKLAAENVQLALTPSQTGKTELLAAFNDRRVDELIDMADKGNAEEIGVLNTNIAANMAKISELTGDNFLADTNSTSKFNFSFGSSSTEQALTAPGTTAVTKAAPTTIIPPGDINAVPPASPAPEVTPTITANVPRSMDPSAVTNNHGALTTSDDGGPSQDKWQRLRELLTEKQYKNLQDLMEAYDRAPEWLKPVIQQSIDIILQGYDISLSNLAR